MDSGGAELGIGEELEECMQEFAGGFLFRGDGIFGGQCRCGVDVVVAAGAVLLVLAVACGFGLDLLFPTIIILHERCHVRHWPLWRDWFGELHETKID